MHALLDEQIAARIKAECRDASELHRFQRVVWILAQLLDALGFPKTSKAFQQLRARAGDIEEQPPATPPEPLVHKLFAVPASATSAKSADEPAAEKRSAEDADSADRQPARPRKRKATA